MTAGGSSLVARSSAVEAVLGRMAAGGEDPLVLLRDLMAAVRPSSAGEPDQAVHTWRAMLALFDERADYREAAGKTVFALLAGREQRSLYTEAGLLPNTGFFSELRRKIGHKLLPEVVDEQNLRDTVRVVFPGSAAWLRAIPAEDRAAFWKAVSGSAAGSPQALGEMREQLLDAAVILGHRIASMGLEPELLRLLPRLARGESPFTALSDHLALFVRQCRHAGGVETGGAEEGAHLLVRLDQCSEAVSRAHRVAASRGTSMALTFLLVRLHQHLERLGLLLRVLAAGLSGEARAELAERWSAFLLDAIEGEQRRDSIRTHLSGLLGLLSLRVTENAGRTGEHYIALNRAEWAGMWRAAAVGGVFIAVLALLKIHGAALHLAVLNQGLLNGAIYGIGFAVIHLCHGTVATKQPAMTAATLASALGKARGTARETEGAVELVAATVRTQGAAIAGNVLVAFPLAVTLALTLRAWLGTSIPPEKAAALLKDVDPLAGAPLFHAGVAGVWLFAAGLMSGYVDNLVAYGRVGERVAKHHSLAGLIGGARAERVGGYLEQNAGGLAGNLFFGLMLGITPVFGAISGLPLDIRHIAFSAANLGYALAALDFGLAPRLVVRCGAGVLLIGVVNLTVSFVLALWVALRSHNASMGSLRGLLPALGRQLRTSPSQFFFPAREER